MRVLVVEDSERLQLALRTGLQKSGFTVDVVGSGRDGWAHARRNDYDVVVLDLMLPELDGLTVLRRLRAEGHQTHVLVLTAKGTVAERVAGLRAGADDYLVKPFQFEELVARIEALGRRRVAPRKPVLDVGELRIDPSRQRVTVGDRTVDLTRREFALLHYLALRQEQVVTRTEIEDHLYHGHNPPSSNAVDSAVCVVRRKLRAAGCEHAIETRRGSGYVLSAVSAGSAGSAESAGPAGSAGGP